MSSLTDKIERLSRPNVKILSDHMRGIIIYCFLNFKSPSILQVIISIIDTTDVHTTPEIGM